MPFFRKFMVSMAKLSQIETETSSELVETCQMMKQVSVMMKLSQHWHIWIDHGDISDQGCFFGYSGTNINVIQSCYGALKTDGLYWAACDNWLNWCGMEVQRIDKAENLLSTSWAWTRTWSSWRRHELLLGNFIFFPTYIYADGSCHCVSKGADEYILDMCDVMGSIRTFPSVSDEEKKSNGIIYKMWRFYENWN